MKKCSIPSCQRKQRSKSYCGYHYYRHRIYGNANYQSGRKTTRRGEAKAFLENAKNLNVDDCVLWPYNQSLGYGFIHINKSNVGAHRWICEEVNGPPPFEKAEAAHLCGYSLCINLRHIRWATHSDNCKDRKRHGSVPVGEKASRSKLNREQVLFIRKDMETSKEKKKSAIRISEEFNISISHVNAIYYRKTWEWLE